MDLGHEINDLIQSCTDPMSAANRALGALVSHVQTHGDPIQALGAVEGALFDLKAAQGAAERQLEKDEERHRQAESAHEVSIGIRGDGSQTDRP